MKPQPYLIAEIGVNHNGSIDLAKQMIDSAKASGADCVKFQAFDVGATETRAPGNAPGLDL